MHQAEKNELFQYDVKMALLLIYMFIYYWTINNISCLNSKQDTTYHGYHAIDAFKTN